MLRLMMIVMMMGVASLVSGAIGTFVGAKYNAASGWLSNSRENVQQLLGDRGDPLQTDPGQAERPVDMDPEDLWNGPDGRTRTAADEPWSEDHGNRRERWENEDDRYYRDGDRSRDHGRDRDRRSRGQHYDARYDDSGGTTEARGPGTGSGTTTGVGPTDGGGTTTTATTTATGTTGGTSPGTGSATGGGGRPSPAPNPGRSGSRSS